MSILPCSCSINSASNNGFLRQAPVKYVPFVCPRTQASYHIQFSKSQYPLQLQPHHHSFTNQSLTLTNSELELYRLEQKYSRRRNRNTFVTDAQYVDGVYVHTHASSPHFSQSTSNVASPVSSQSTGSWGTGKLRKRKSMIWSPRQ